MNIKEAHAVLTDLLNHGHGELPLVVVDTRSGISDEASIYSGVRRVTHAHAAGWECDQPEGKMYVAAFIG